jgi:hypothetical protein
MSLGRWYPVIGLDGGGQQSWRPRQLWYQFKTALRPHGKPKWVFGQYFVNLLLNPTIIVSYCVVNTLMMKT